MPIEPVTSNSPLYDRPSILKIDSETKIKTPKIKESEIISSLLKILSSPNITSKNFIYEKYDSGVQNRAFLACGNQAGVVRYGKEYEIIEKEEENKNFMLSQIMLSKKGCGALNFLHDANSKEVKYTTQKALVISSTCTPKFVKSNPVEGAIHAVVESYRNICATGGTPSALTNCLNFGNPTNPEIMGQIKGAIEGISKAAKALNTPVISGNVSLYNETDGKSINPTPTIGMVGIMKDYTKAIPNAISNEEEHIFLIGDLGSHLTNTTYAEVCEGVCGGAIPRVDLDLEKQTGEFLQKAIDERVLSSCGDISHGGFLTAIAKMCVKGGVGANINLHHIQGAELITMLFNEDNARYICTVSKGRSIDFINNAIESNIIYTQIGFTAGKTICINSVHEVSLEDCKKALNSLAEFFAG